MPLYYDARKNPEGRSFDGVPLRDLTDDELAELPTWLRASVLASEFYATEAPAQLEQLGEADGVEKTPIEATPGGTPAELDTTTTTSPEGAAPSDGAATLTDEEPAPRRRR